MNEIISLHIGGSGISLAEPCWQLFDLNGSVPSTAKWDCLYEVQDEEAIKTPRALYIDSDTTLLDEMRVSNRFAHKNDGSADYQFIDGNGENQFESLVEQSIESVRIMAEKCSSLQGFIFYGSIGGETSSCVTSKLLDRLSEEFSRKSKVGITIYPSIAETTNESAHFSVSTLSSFISNNMDMSIVYDNEGINTILKKHLKISDPSHKQRNHLIAEAWASLSTGLRWNSFSMNVTLHELALNHVPYPSLLFALCSHSSIVPLSDNGDDNSPVNLDQDDAIMISSANNQGLMASCNPTIGKCLGAYSHAFFGTWNIHDIRSSIATYKKLIHYPDWVSTWTTFGFEANLPYHFNSSGWAWCNRYVNLLLNSSKTIQKIYHNTFLQFSGDIHLGKICQ